MDANHLRNLQSSGVWPEGFTLNAACCPVPNTWDYRVAKALLIVAMLDKLPRKWNLYRWTDFNCDEHWAVSRDEPVDIFDHDLFACLFKALVSAGIVKEEQTVPPQKEPSDG